MLDAGLAGSRYLPTKSAGQDGARVHSNNASKVKKSRNLGNDWELPLGTPDGFASRVNEILPHVIHQHRSSHPLLRQPHEDPRTAESRPLLLGTARCASNAPTVCEPGPGSLSGQRLHGPITPGCLRQAIRIHSVPTFPT